MSPSRRKRISVLISGRGSNMMSILDSCERGEINGDIVVVISNKADAEGLTKAAARGVQTLVISHRAFPDRESFDRAVVAELENRQVDLVCLAGFMRLLSPWFIKSFRNRIMNIHPALLPSFPGLHGQKQAIDFGVKISGATVHFVDENLDHGPIIIQRAVEVRDDDTEDSLSERILKIEHQIYPEAVRLFCDDRLRLNGRKVSIMPCRASRPRRD
jgi:phosphoribosylglycinamide formyltransferase-1